MGIRKPAPTIAEQLADFEYAVRARTMSEVLQFIEGYAKADDTPAPVAQAARHICDGLVIMYGEPSAKRPLGIMYANAAAPPSGGQEETE